ncbi:MAG: hypothetical protein UT27_C0015G0002 [Candidatus Nomurabacteria bacterium GW2011_GWD2_39_12]|uniref:Uncharacterized protein n=1 Tax=Candidatus Nomurabacteria bacterium GW2011_GWD2_39_12 TaxID=1618759 RepID=A0A837HPU2_9BACT|nr:MAG: hypothetical protein UT27_C0015G0002 [Candidatus Nomurabacteria bacterium GW2011_GWD2_39_12]KKR74039.1 MAG: hypothetical protein UU17_C0021G0008 [Candidatus Nomurabacteria bacterium GW2011_GWA1_40_8]
MPRVNFSQFFLYGVIAKLLYTRRVPLCKVDNSNFLEKITKQNKEKFLSKNMVRKLCISGYF